MQKRRRNRWASKQVSRRYIFLENYFVQTDFYFQETAEIIFIRVSQTTNTNPTILEWGTLSTQRWIVSVPWFKPDLGTIYTALSSLILAFYQNISIMKVLHLSCEIDLCYNKFGSKHESHIETYRCLGGVYRFIWSLSNGVPRLFLASIYTVWLLSNNIKAHR